jgi:hypothetical protein
MVSEMTDRYDNLLLKARAEVLGKHTLRAEPSTDAVFETVWEGLQKGFFGGAKRGWQKNRTAPGRSKRMTDDAYTEYQRRMEANPWQAPKPPDVPLPKEEPVEEEPVEEKPAEAGFAAMENGGNQEPPSLSEPEPIPPPEEWINPPPPSFARLRAGREPMTLPQADSALLGPFKGSFREPGHNLLKPPGVGANADPPEPEIPSLERANKDILSGNRNVGAQGPPSVGVKPEIADANAVLDRKVPYNLDGDPIPPPKPPRGMAGTRKLAPTPEPEPEPEPVIEAPKADEKMPGPTLKDRPPAPLPNEATVEAGTERQKVRAAKRPQPQQTLFGEETIPYSEYSKHIQAAMKGDEKALAFLRDNPNAVAEHSPEGLPERIADALGGEKKASNDAFNSAWSVLKDPFANPFDNPNAFAIHNNFKISKNDDDLPKEFMNARPSHMSDEEWEKEKRKREMPLSGSYTPHGKKQKRESRGNFSPEFQDKLASADTSLLPQGMLKQMQGQQRTEADYSLLPQGWREEVVN